MLSHLRADQVGCSFTTPCLDCPSGEAGPTRPRAPSARHVPRRCQGAPPGAPSAASLPSDSVAGAWHSAVLPAQQSPITRTRDDPVIKVQPLTRRSLRGREASGSPPVLSLPCPTRVSLPLGTANLDASMRLTSIVPMSYPVSQFLRRFVGNKRVIGNRDLPGIGSGEDLLSMHTRTVDRSRREAALSG